MVPWILLPAALLEAALIASAVRKARHAGPSIELRDALNVAPPLWSAIGVLEGCAAIGLLAGLIQPAAGAVAAFGSALLMAGAVGAHLRVGLRGRPLGAPLVLLASAVAAGLGFAASV